MTDADVERVARRLCAIRRLDPDEVVKVYPPGRIGFQLSKRWMAVAPEVLVWHELATAFRQDAQPGDLTVPAVTVPR